MCEHHSQPVCPTLPGIHTSDPNLSVRCGDPSTMICHHHHSPCCRQVAFAPRQLGLVLAAACRDGGVHVLEADRLLAPDAWTVQSTFKAVVRVFVCVWGGAFYSGGAPLGPPW